MSNPPMRSNAVYETVKTDETISITNQQFMECVFGNAPADARPVTVSFPGNPKSGTWTGRAWGSGKVLAPPHQNNYFSLSTYRPDADNKYKRRKQQVARLHAVMLDDIGTKCTVERMAATPSWLLETSAANYQAGFLLVDPIDDAKSVEQLLQAFIDAGLTDPGANGPMTRLARLPVGTNGKHDPGFSCRLVSFNPKIRYTPEELLTAFNLTVAPQKKKQTKTHLDPAFKSLPDNTQKVLDALKNLGLYKRQQSEGHHDMTCPWVNEHTDSVDSGTMYFEPSDDFPIGGFKCQHGHCADRHLSDLLRHLKIQDVAVDRPTILVQKGELGRVVDKAQLVLANSNRFYSRCGEVIFLHVPTDSDIPVIKTATGADVLYELSHIVNWTRYDAKTEAEFPIDPPDRVIKTLGSLSHHRHIPELLRISCQPFFRKDLSLVTMPGLDKETSTYGHFAPVDYNIPESPTRLDAEQALASIRELLVEFEFANDFDESAAISAMLTAAIRPSLRLAPMFHVKAHAQGSGKSFLCELITSFATRAPRCAATFSEDHSEFNKVVIAELRKAPLVIEFDNLTCDLKPHPSLCAMLTSEFISGRILQESKTLEFPTRCLLLSSGNNVGPVGDMTRRCVTINLSPQCENPALRTFKRPTLLQDVQENRPKYISAVLTMVKAWINAGKPITPCHTVASFGDWNELCRQPLLWLGLPDPAQAITEAISEDPEREEIDRFLTAWHARFYSAPTRVRDAVALCSPYTRGNDDLKECINSIALDRGEINTRRLGKWMKRHVGQIVNGKRIAKCNTRGSVEQWRVEIVRSASGVSSVSSVSEFAAERLPPTAEKETGRYS